MNTEDTSLSELDEAILRAIADNKKTDTEIFSHCLHNGYSSLTRNGLIFRLNKLVKLGYVDRSSSVSWPYGRLFYSLKK